MDPERVAIGASAGKMLGQAVEAGRRVVGLAAIHGIVSCESPHREPDLTQPTRYGRGLHQFASVVFYGGGRSVEFMDFGGYQFLIGKRTG